MGAVLQGAAWQRCRVHFMRNVLTKVPKADADMVATWIRTIFTMGTPGAIRAQLDRGDELDEVPAEGLTVTTAKKGIVALTAFSISTTTHPLHEP